MIKATLRKMGFSGSPVAIEQFRSEEDQAPYQVWRIDYADQSYVLKQAQGQEKELYKTYFSSPCAFVPMLYSSENVEGSDYLLLEYVPGNTLTHCTREALIRALDALIAMQGQYWNSKMAPQALDGRMNRLSYLQDTRLEKAYQDFLTDCRAIPATLCHDDLLPFNVIDRGDRAVFIDWEVGGILPYPTSLARLIAHGEEGEDAFFVMKEDDRRFAIDYYHDHFIREKGIDYSTYRRSLDLCIFYEYCEWIYLGNRFQNSDSDRFRSYYTKAIRLADKLGY